MTRWQGSGSTAKDSIESMASMCKVGSFQTEVSGWTFKHTRASMHYIIHYHSPLEALKKRKEKENQQIKQTKKIKVIIVSWQKSSNTVGLQLLSTSKHKE